MDYRDIKACDVLIFSDTTVHKALPNKRNRVRQSFDARYKSASAPIAKSNLNPYSGTGNWREIYSKWGSDATQCYWKKQNLNAVPFDTRYYEAREQMAFEMAENGDLLARDILLRIVQRDSNQNKVKHAQSFLDAMDGPKAMNL